MHELIVNFAPTGIVPQKEDNPNVPVSPVEIIEQVHEAYEIGITVVHLHARKKDGSPEYKAKVYREILEGVNRYCPDLVTCFSLSGRIYNQYEHRSEALELKPDMASLTLSSMNFTRQANINAPEMILRLANRMNELGVNPELECFDNGMIHYSKYLITKGIITPPYYYNILLGNLYSAQVDLGHINILLKDLPAGSLWALAGIGTEQLKANTIAIAAGGGVRVGLEDNIWFDQNKTHLATNKDLLLRIHQMAKIFERKMMPSKDFGNMGFYNRHKNSI